MVRRVADLRDMQEQHRTERAIHDLQHEDDQHQQQEVFKREHVTEADALVGVAVDLLALRFGIVGGMLFMGVFLGLALRRWDASTVLPWGLVPVVLAVAECVRFVMRPPPD